MSDTFVIFCRSAQLTAVLARLVAEMDARAAVVQREVGFAEPALKCLGKGDAVVAHLTVEEEEA